MSVLESGTWSASRGTQATAWAEEFAAFQDARHGLALANGTVTLEAALAACEIGEGDEVIVPGLTFVASATAVLAVNATPILVDVDPDTLCIDAAAAEAAIGERTRGLIAVHVAGRPCDMDALEQLCEQHGLALIEDCAHAHGSHWRGRGVGSFGSFGSFSFEAHKLMTAGEGGALTTGDEALRARAWSYANCGRVEGEHWYHHARYGSNMRISEWQGAVLRAQLRRYPQQLKIREERAALLDKELAELDGVVPQPGDARIDRRARYAYVFRYEPDAFAGLSPEGFAAALAAEGIVFGDSYPSLNTVQLFREGNFSPRMRAHAPDFDYGRLNLPAAEHAAAFTVWIEHRVLLSDPEDVLDVARAVSRIQQHAGAISFRTGRIGKLAARVASATSRVTGSRRQG